jgi:hypothetical protein
MRLNGVDLSVAAGAVLIEGQAQHFKKLIDARQNGIKNTHSPNQRACMDNRWRKR